ncbi:hypothetical protein NMY22_g13698 [Coprinellus aureogranulatus]|nr:hypothetical protein NMY22_g13698 [Coprinellus aureogranulatus]
MSSAFPLELVLLVISHVDREQDQSSLKSFSQTSSTFRDLCQGYLFRHIVLAGSQSATAQRRTPGERFLDVLSSSPRLIPHVKQITISDFENPWASWLPNDLKLAEALDKLDLKKIERFELKRNYRANWMQVQQPARRVIVEICRSPALVELSLWWSPLALLGACTPSLKHLRVHDCSVGVYASDIAPMRRSSAISLHSIRVYHSFDLDRVADYFLDCSNQVQVDRLRMVHLTPSIPEDYGYMRKFLGACQNSVETLKMETCSENGMSPCTLPSDKFSQNGNSDY